MTCNSSYKDHDLLTIPTNVIIEVRQAINPASTTQLFKCHMGSLVAQHGLLSSCGTWAWLPRGICGILVLGPGMELASLALQDGFLTSEPPGKSPTWFWVKLCLNTSSLSFSLNGK